LVEFNLHIKKHITLFDIGLGAFSKNVGHIISSISKTISYQHEKNEYKHTKTFKIQRCELWLTWLTIELIIKYKVKNSNTSS
jgi:hypothetical protein